ncbi:LacI family DNA-binding transcriptional regulator [Cellulomonas sp. NPDC089187]|uniref:LacI family DNA-binding transcriptional regulator n=1 Tax=Cellulomonas sp. NPDC089187 TaxID=3154970 RepID=UPI00343E3CC7
MLESERKSALLREIRLRGAVRTQDVAQRLGVSPVTVRRDLRELADEGAVIKVHGGATAAPAPHSPHHPTRRDDPSAVLGVLLPSADYYYAKTVRGAQEVAARQGVRLVLAVSRNDPESEPALIERFVDIGVDALLVAPAAPAGAPEGAATWHRLGELPVPVVVVERESWLVPETLAHDAVFSDHRHGVQLALAHLAELGHRRVVLALDTHTAPSLRIGEAFDQVAESLGLVTGLPRVGLPRAAADSEAVHQAVHELVRVCREAEATAVLVHPDHYAITLTELAPRLGLSIPEQLSVIAYDDEQAGLAQPELTAVAPAKAELGRTAVMLAMTRLSAPLMEPSTTRRVALLPTLTVRKSTISPVG